MQDGSILRSVNHLAAEQRLDLVDQFGAVGVVFDEFEDRLARVEVALVRQN